MSVVREEFGPSLPALLRPRLDALPRPLRLALAAVAAAVVLLVVWLLFLRPTPGQTATVIRGAAPTFNLLYGDGLQRVAPREGEALRLEQRAGAPQSMTVRELPIEPYQGDVTAALMAQSTLLIDAMRREYRDFVWRGDGRVALNKQPGYQVLFQATIDGRLTYGKRVLLAPTADPPPSRGLEIMLLAARSPVVPNLDAVGANGALKLPYRSLRFGEERP